MVQGSEVQGSGFRGSGVQRFRGLRLRGSAQPPAIKTTGQIEKKTALIHSAIIVCGSGLQPRFTRSDKHFLMFHTSDAVGRERPVKSNEKLMNVEHPPAMHRALSWRNHWSINQMVKFTSHRLQGIAGRSNVQHRTSNNVCRPSWAFVSNGLF
jgi:hypothetical protein